MLQNAELFPSAASRPRRGTSIQMSISEFDLYGISVFLRVCERHEGTIHEGGHGPVFVGEHPMGNIPFPSPEVGDNAIEAWYAKGIDFWNTIQDSEVANQTAAFSC